MGNTPTLGETPGQLTPRKTMGTIRDKPILYAAEIAEIGFLPCNYAGVIEAPSNLVDVRQRLLRPRTDIPDQASFLDYKQNMEVDHGEQAVRGHLADFLGFRPLDGIHRSAMVSWTNITHALPRGKVLVPDFTCGLDGLHQATRKTWIRDALPLFVDQNQIMSVNCVIECGSLLDGSIYTAVGC